MGRVGGADEAAFVGRERELATLRGLLDGALADRGALALLAGEPGIGKTRLAEELALIARQRGAAVLWGRCWESEGAPAFRPWVEALRPLLRGDDAAALVAGLGPAAAELAQLLLEVRELQPALPALPVAALLDADEARFRLFDAVAGLLRAAAARTPALLALEDLHWADKPSILLLQFLARELAEMPLLLLGSYRDSDLDRRHPLAEALPSLRREHTSARLVLRGLDGDGVRALLEALLAQPSGERGAAFAAALHAETEGNPFFVQQIVRHLQESGRLFRREGRWTSDARSIDELALPEGVREVVGRRLARLSEPAQRVLSSAAVLGREFAFPVLAQLAALSDDALLDAIEEALAARLLEEAPGRTVARYAFVHALVRQTLYDELSLPRKHRLHARALAALEAVYGAQPEAQLPALAFHAFQAAPAGDVDKAVDYARRAAERATTQLAHEEAAHWYDIALQALELREPVDQVRRCDLLVALSAAQYHAGDRELAAQTAWQAVAPAKQLGDGRLLALAAIAWGKAKGSRAGSEEGIALIETALALCGELESPLVVLLCFGLAVGVSFGERADIDRARELSARAVALARKLNDGRGLTLALGVWMVVHASPDYFAEVEQTLPELERAVQQWPDATTIAYAGSVALWVALNRGPRARIDRSAEECRAGVMAHPTRVFAAYAQLATALCAALDGDFGSVREAIERVLLDRTSAHAGSVRYVNMAFRHLLWREQDRRSGSVELIEQGFLEAPWDSIGRAHLLLAYCDAGRLDDARQELARLTITGFDAYRRHPGGVVSLALCAEVAVALGDREPLRALYAVLRPYAGYAAAFVLHPYLGAVDRYLGLLAGALSEYEDGEQHFVAAQQIHAALETPPWLAHTRHDWARLLLACGRPGDRERAAGMLAEALATAKRLGMIRLARQIEELGAIAPEPAQAAPRYPNGLSEREVEVLRLLAAGKSNPEIATALVISLNTVYRHTNHIFTKTGAGNRVEAATYAHRQGLV